MEIYAALVEIHESNPDQARTLALRFAVASATHVLRDCPNTLSASKSLTECVVNAEKVLSCITGSSSRRAMARAAKAATQAATQASYVGYGAFDDSLATLGSAAKTAECCAQTAVYVHEATQTRPTRGGKLDDVLDDVYHEAQMVSNVASGCRGAHSGPGAYESGRALELRWQWEFFCSQATPELDSAVRSVVAALAPEWSATFAELVEVVNVLDVTPAHA